MVCTKRWVQCPALHQLGVAGHTYNSGLWGLMVVPLGWGFLSKALHVDFALWVLKVHGAPVLEN